MSSRELLTKIVNLILESDEASSDWVNNAPLRRCFYALFWLNGVMLLVYVIRYSLIDALYSESFTALIIYRYLSLLVGISGVVITIITSYYYFRYVLINKAKIYLTNIIAFYVLAVVFFALSYLNLFILFPHLFTVESPPAAMVNVTTKLPISFKAEFFLFSAFQSVNGSYFRIHVNSAFVAVMTYIQAVFTISLISLLIASYVNQISNKSRT